MGMVTDTLRIKRTDPGHPERCNVCQLHRFFGDDYEEIWDGERTARTGCVDTKKLLVERLLAPLRAGARAVRRPRWRTPSGSTAILEEGAARLRPIVDATIAEVREKMGLR